MANIMRSPKHAHDWTINDLDTYNINIVAQDAATFFGQSPPLPLPPHNLDLLSKLTADEMEDDESYQVVQYMDLAMSLIPGEESAVVDFAMQLLRTMGYVGRSAGRVLRSRKDIPLFTCGKWRHAKTDVCIMDNDGILLLVLQEDKQHLELGDPRPPLIAEAIAAVQHNNHVRDLLGLAPLDMKVMAGITMTGTSPAFFKVPVTSELIQAIQRGQYPARPTTVALHRPDIPRPAHRLREGMRPLDNRLSMLACFEAFKQFVNWSASSFHYFQLELFNRFENGRFFVLGWLVPPVINPPCLARTAGKEISMICNLIKVQLGALCRSRRIKISISLRDLETGYAMRTWFGNPSVRNNLSRQCLLPNAIVARCNSCSCRTYSSMGPKTYKKTTRSCYIFPAQGLRQCLRPMSSLELLVFLLVFIACSSIIRALPDGRPHGNTMP